MKKIAAESRNRVEFWVNGAQVVLRGVYATCTHCQQHLPLTEFGDRLRSMGTHTLVLRNQPQCKECRGRYRKVV